MLDAAEIRDVFKRNPFCVIATASLTGEPWLSPVFYNYSPEYSIVWESAADALHSQHIAANPRIAIFIKDTQEKGPAADLYIEATAREVAFDRAGQAFDVWASGPHGHSDNRQRDVDDYALDKPMRLYEAKIEHLYVLDETVVDGYRADVRVEVDVDMLRTAGI